jgi:cytochrome c peroxidase
MRLTKTVLKGIIILIIATACSNVEKSDKTPISMLLDHSVIMQAREHFKPLPEQAMVAGNDLTMTKLQLGKVLFYDKRLSKNNTQSCNSCHNLSTYGVDQKATSPGDLGKNGNRNSPTVYNAALHATQFWDGRASDVEQQAGMPILNPVEMNIPSEKFLIDRLSGIEGYRKLFKEAFPNDPNPINYKNLRLAIAAFERTLITPSRFNEYMNGNLTALTPEEQTGMRIFINIGCTNCHNGAALGGGMIQRFPAKKSEYRSFTGSKREDLGLMEQTGDTLDKFKFKVPSLLNITETYPYFHDGSVNNLDSAIVIMAATQLDKKLNTEEVKKIKAFLGSLKCELPGRATIEPAMPK